MYPCDFRAWVLFRTRDRGDIDRIIFRISFDTFRLLIFRSMRFAYALAIVAATAALPSCEASDAPRQVLIAKERACADSRRILADPRSLALLDTETLVQKTQHAQATMHDMRSVAARFALADDGRSADARAAAACAERSVAAMVAVLRSRAFYIVGFDIDESG
jgi:hypothetical protein